MTTPKTTSPDLTPDLTDYRVIHHALRTAPHRMAAALAEFEGGDRVQARALLKYWVGYAGEVFAHHTIEDEIFFPRLVERVPIAGQHLAQVEADHHHLDRLMGACHRALTELARTTSEGSAFEAAIRMRELATHMDQHLDFEDELLVPLFGLHFSAAEYEAMHEAAMKHLGIGKQAAYTVPFVMYWAEPADRDHLIAGAPAIMRVLWKLTRGGHARLTSRALRAAAPSKLATPVEVVS
jgi:hemerythrin-like domain-containing protein